MKSAGARQGTWKREMGQAEVQRRGTGEHVPDY